MHEIGVVRSMVKTVTAFAEANQITDIAEIVVDVGELSLVIPKYVEDIYPHVVEDTFLKNTKLILNIVPGMAECDECNEVFNVVEHKGYCPFCHRYLGMMFFTGKKTYCPHCGSFEKTILTGRDFLIREIHIPE